MVHEWLGDGSDVIYLDNAATTFPKPTIVYEAADHFYRHYGGNAGRGGNPLARRSSRLLAETRALLAALFQVPSTEQIVFTSSVTHALNLAILGASWRPRDVVYVTPFEHNSVLRPVEHLRVTQGVEVRRIPFARRTYACQLDRLEAAFKAEPPSMVCVTQASNVCGVMPPVEAITRLAKESNPRAVIVVDGAQTGGLFPLPLDENLIDAFVFSGHKSLYGPYGIAGVVLATDWRPTPLMFGGTGTVSESVQMPTTTPSAYEAGSHNIWAVAGLRAALEWLQETGCETVCHHTLSLASSLRQGLERIPECDVYAPPENVQWCGILSFTLETARPQVLETALGAAGIAVRAGLHCAPWAHEWLGTMERGGTVRISTGWSNKSAHIERLCAALSNFT